MTCEEYRRLSMLDGPPDTDSECVSLVRHCETCNDCRQWTERQVAGLGLTDEDVAQCDGWIDDHNRRVASRQDPEL